MYQTITLPNGIRLLTQQVPQARTAALGFFVGVGSRHETAAESGAAHFIEHMLFKGTSTMDAIAIAEETDTIGGQVNAYTTKDCTCFYARCLDSHLDRAAELLMSMLLDSNFDQSDVELERGVIFEEIGMYEDTPDELCADRLAAVVYGGSPLARPVLGKTSTLNKMTGESLKNWQREHYRPDRIVISLTGHFDASSIDHIVARMSAMEAGKTRTGKKADYRSAITVKKKAIEQNHLMLAFPALSYLDERRYQLLILNSILGGGVSSRLFQELREKRGLCYSVYSYVADHADTGMVGIYTALGKSTEEEALAAICREVRRLAQDGPTEAELARVREQAKANVVMGLESIQSKMSHLGTSTLLFDKVRTVDDIIASYDAITMEQLRVLAAEVFDFSQVSLSAVGRVDTVEGYRKRLAEASGVEVEEISQ